MDKTACTCNSIIQDNKSCRSVVQLSLGQYKLNTQSSLILSNSFSPLMDGNYCNIKMKSSIRSALAVRQGWSIFKLDQAKLSLVPGFNLPHFIKVTMTYFQYKQSAVESTSESRTAV